MIIPQTRLLFWVAVGVIPFSTLAFMLPESRIPAILILLVFAILVLLDAIQSRFLLHDIHIELPDIFRFVQGKEQEITMHLVQSSLKSRTIRMGIAFPSSFEAPTNDKNILLPEGGIKSEISWTCIPQQRGEFLLKACYFEMMSPFKMWSIRKTISTHSQLRIYPNLISERDAARFYLRNNREGTHLHRQVGKGREFEKLREYIPGDSYEDIHWKATAKRGFPITKMYQIESQQEIFVALDSSRLSARLGFDGVSFLEKSIKASLILGNVVERQNDAFGVMSFSDKVHGFVRPKCGPNNYLACRDILYNLQPNRVTPDFEEACSFLRLNLRKRSLILFLTSLDDVSLSENMIRGLDLICKQHIVFIGYFKADAYQPLFSQPHVSTLDDLYSSLGGHLVWSELKETESKIRKQGVLCSPLSPDKMAVQIISQYLDIKRRQVL